MRKRQPQKYCIYHQKLYTATTKVAEITGMINERLIGLKIEHKITEMHT